MAAVEGGEVGVMTSRPSPRGLWPRDGRAHDGKFPVWLQAQSKLKQPGLLGTPRQ